MRGEEILASFLPQIIVSHLLDSMATPIIVNEEGDVTPTRQEFETVVLFADISGFTKLSETMNKKYKERGNSSSFLIFPFILNSIFMF